VLSEKTVLDNNSATSSDQKIYKVRLPAALPLGEFQSGHVLSKQFDLRVVAHLHLLLAGFTIVKGYGFEPAALLVERVTTIRARPAEHNVGQSV
jgi:hypothetical protein